MFPPLYLQMDANTQTNAYLHFCIYTLLCTHTKNNSLLYFLYFFCCFGFRYSALLLPFLSPVYFSSKCFDLLTTDRRSESRHSGCRHQNISPYLLWECLCVSISLGFLAFHSLMHSPEPPAVLIGDTDTGLLHLLFLQMWLFCCNVYSYSPSVSTQLCVNVTLRQSFLLGAVNL